MLQFGIYRERNEYYDRCYTGCQSPMGDSIAVWWVFKVWYNARRGLQAGSVKLFLLLLW